MRKFMNGVAVKYSGVIVFIKDFDYNKGKYLVEDKQGFKTYLSEDKLKFLTDK